jgi:hypothetical protein
MGQPTQPDPEPRQRAATLHETVRAVLWAFFGVRRKADYEKDAARLNPVHVIVIGIGAAALLVLALIMIVRAVAG